MATLQALDTATGQIRNNSSWVNHGINSALIGGGIALGGATTGLGFLFSSAGFLKSGYDLAGYNDDFGAAKLQAEADQLGKDWKEQADAIKHMQKTIDSINDLLKDLNEKYDSGCPPCKDKP